MQAAAAGALATSQQVDDYAQSMGAALAYYTVFSIAPLLLIVISIALVFGDQAARGEIFSQPRSRYSPDTYPLARARASHPRTRTTFGTS
jgi:uncharacterized BrkB/YihY/UPF0761 family membrane protein